MGNVNLVSLEERCIMNKHNFIVGSRARIVPNYSDSTLQNHICIIVAIQNDNKYLVRMIGGSLEGRGVLIDGDSLR